MALEQLLEANAVGRERVIAIAARLKPKFTAGVVSSQIEAAAAACAWCVS
jgi:hypothetical protein